MWQRLPGESLKYWVHKLHRFNDFKVFCDTFSTPGNTLPWKRLHHEIGSGIMHLSILRPRRLLTSPSLRWRIWYWSSHTIFFYFLLFWFWKVRNKGAARKFGAVLTKTTLKRKTQIATKICRNGSILLLSSPSSSTSTSASFFSFSFFLLSSSSSFYVPH